jgi:hypothetical protein
MAHKFQDPISWIDYKVYAISWERKVWKLWAGQKAQLEPQTNG